MKKKVMIKRIAAFLMSISVMPRVIPNTAEYVYAAESTVVLESDALYDEMSEICPGISAYEKDGVLNITIPSIDMSNGTNPAALKFMKTAARLLNCQECSNYSAVVIGYFKEDGLIILNAGEYKDASNFITTLTVNFDDTTFNDWANSYYESIFGHFDSEHFFSVMEGALLEGDGIEDVPEPEAKSVDEYLLFGCTPDNLSKYDISNRTVYIHLTDLDDSEAEGVRIASYVTKFYKQMARFYNAKNVCSFDQCEFICIGKNGQLLRTVGFYVENNKMEVSNNFSYSTDFTNGFNSAIG